MLETTGWKRLAWLQNTAVLLQKAGIAVRWESSAQHGPALPTRLPAQMPLCFPYRCLLLSSWHFHLAQPVDWRHHKHPCSSKQHHTKFSSVPDGCIFPMNCYCLVDVPARFWKRRHSAMWCPSVYPKDISTALKKWP